ncbi:MAG: hypothetical protein HOH43_02045 [Candidatus Latescibacteria bacterium]|nr:hypothetical protein [Candidatus Latescibacterota bacterium]
MASSDQPQDYVGDPSIGFSLTDDSVTGYPKVQRVSEAFYGKFDNIIMPGTRIIEINGESMYRKSAEQAGQLLSGELYEKISLKTHDIENAVTENDLPFLLLTSEPAWLTEEPEDHTPRLFPVRDEESKKWGYIDALGSVIIEPQYEDVKSSTYTSTAFSSGLEAVKSGYTWGFINLQGEMILGPKWVNVTPFRGGFAGILHSGDIRYGFAGGGRIGYIDVIGNEIIAPIYEQASFTSGFSEGMSAVRQDKKSGFIDDTGSLVIPFQYAWVESFSDGLAKVLTDIKGKAGYIDKGGNWVVEPKFAAAYAFHDGQAVVAEEKDGPYQAIGQDGETRFFFEISPITSLFTEKRVIEGRFLGISPEGKFGFMDEQGKVVIPARYVDSDDYFSEGLVGVTETGVGEGNSLVKKQGGWFFIDSMGNTIIEGPFEEVNRFTEGLCWVKQYGQWGAIDTEGDWVIQPDIDSRPGVFKNGIARINLLRDEGGFLKEQYVMYYSKSGYAAWRPFY